MEKNLYIGLMSGTSVDSIDGVVARFSEHASEFAILTHYSHPFPDDLRHTTLALSQSGQCSLKQLGELDCQFGMLFAQCVFDLLKKSNLKPMDICAIGSHGQTIWHHPQGPYAFTLQIGNPFIIAKQTGILTIADFRRADMVLGGQGAPLVPAFHQWLFAHPNKDRIVLNIGGIANISVLSNTHRMQLIGFDTGPGNGLLDAWTQQHLQLPYDTQGAWAKTGQISIPLLNQLLDDPYFKQTAPKSTGKHYFNLEWLQTYLQSFQLNPVDVQATLIELTARTISDAIARYSQDGELLVCGGGIYNDFLIERIKFHLPHFTLASTAQYALDPQWVEAACFAWLSYQRLNERPGNVPAVTGASAPSLLGAVYAPS